MLSTLMVNTMKLNVSGLWKRVWPQIKVAGTWKLSKAVFVKVAGVWKQTVGEPPKDNIYNGTITVGHGTTGGLEIYGFHAEATGGSASPNSTKQAQGFYALTESKEFVGAPEYQWIEMMIAGDISALSFGNCSVNGVIGELVSWEYQSGTNSSYIRWHFPTPLPLTGTWDLIV